MAIDARASSNRMCAVSTDDSEQERFQYGASMCIVFLQLPVLDIFQISVRAEKWSKLRMLWLGI
jgi:hypothetical protein